MYSCAISKQLSGAVAIFALFEDNTYGTEVPVGVNQLEIPVGSGRGVARRTEAFKHPSFDRVLARRKGHSWQLGKLRGSFRIPHLSSSFWSPAGALSKADAL